jgi:hypothetical protein
MVYYYLAQDLNNILFLILQENDTGETIKPNCISNVQNNYPYTSWMAPE